METLESRTLLASFGNPAVGAIVGLSLIDSNADAPISGFVRDNGSTIDLASSGRQLSIRADIAGAPQSVRFNYDGSPSYQVDSSAPYAISANVNGDYSPWTPTLGTHTLIATPYSGPNGTGARGKSEAINFKVIDSAAPPTPIRVNAGGGRYIDSVGNLFAADTGFTGGSVADSDFNIAGTGDDSLYQSRRTGKSFDFSAPTPDGIYTLRLYFADPTSSKPGQRRFDVSAEGSLILDDYDIAADAGKRTAVVKEFTVDVEDGRLDLTFRAAQKKAIVSAIELIASDRSIATPAPLRVNAGGNTFVDSLGRDFDSDAGFSGGSVIVAPYDVQLTKDDPLFYTYRAGPAFTFSQPVANGNYALWLDFADGVSTIPGQRLFEVWAEGKQILDDYDIVKNAGAQTATARSFDVHVNDGMINLSFAGVVGDAIVSAIVLIPTDVPPEARPYTLQYSSDDVKMEQSASNLRDIGWGMLLYSNEHKNKFPLDLATLFDGQITPYQTFANPRTTTALPRGELSLVEAHAWVASLHDYIYLGAGKKNSDSEDAILAYENPDRVTGATNILFGDGRVISYDRMTAAQLIGIPISDPNNAPPPSPSYSPDPMVASSASNLKTLSQGFLAYSNHNRNYLPTDLGLFYRYYGNVGITLQTFINPRGTTLPPADNSTIEQKVDWVNASKDYIYLGAGRHNSQHPDFVIAYENPADMSDGINILFADGRVEFQEMRWAVETLNRSALNASMFEPWWHIY